MKKEIERFKKDYEKIVHQYSRLIGIYESTGMRKSKILPLLWEIDQFLSWIYINHESSLTPIESDDNIRSKIFEFASSDFDYIYSMESYFLKNEEAVKHLKTGDFDEMQLRDFLGGVHAFETRKRYFGNLEELLKIFISENFFPKIINKFNYLLFNSASPYEKISRCICDREFKLSQMSESCVKEIFGRNNTIRFPICNERTLNAMKIIGLKA